MSAQIPNGLVVDIIQNQAGDQHDSLDSHDIYGNDGTAMDERAYNLAHHHHHDQQQQHEQTSIVINQNDISSNDAVLHRNGHFSDDTNDAVILNEHERRLATTAFMHYVQKQSAHLLNNEAPVIVSTSKEMNGIALADIEMDANFVTSMTHMDQNVVSSSPPTSSASLPCMPLDKCINLSNNHLMSKNQSSVVLPPLPPLTPISKLQPTTTRRTRDLSLSHRIIEYKHVIEDHVIDGDDAKFMKMHSDDIVLSSTSSRIVRQNSFDTPNAPRKSLPHKKRITKKMKSISPTDEQLQMQLQQTQYQSAPMYMYEQQQQQQSTSQASQIIQHGEPSPTDTATHHLMCQNQLHVQHVPLEMDHSSPPPAPPQPSSSSVIQQHQSTQFACELCGMQATSQLEFFNHLKVHYEPTNANDSMKLSDLKSAEDNNGLDLSGIDLPTAISTFNALQQNSQNIYEMSVPQNDDRYNDTDATYNVQTNHHHTKPEQSHEFSDTEDMIESGVIEKVQRTVDNYIKNHSGDMKDTHTKNWFQPQHEANDLSNHIVYQMTKPTDDCALDPNEFQMTRQSNGNSVIERIMPSTTTSDELTLIYKINGKDLAEHYQSLIDDSTSNTILRNQLIKTNEHVTEECEFVDDGTDGDGDIAIAVANGIVMDVDVDVDGSGDAEDGEQSVNYVIAKKSNTFLRMEDFSEQEKTDSDADGSTATAGNVRKKKKIYRCKRCDKLCYSKNALHYHFLSHTGERRYVCDVCGKSFYAGSALKVHKRLHTGDKPYECTVCARPFRQWGDLKYHMQSLHTNEKNHQCEFCGKEFARRYSLVIHRRIHTGERNYKCEYCDKEFRASSYLQVHRKIHTGEKPYDCVLCGKKFRVRGDLKRHANIHERGKNKDAKASDDTAIADGLTANVEIAQNMFTGMTLPDVDQMQNKKVKKRNSTKTTKMIKVERNSNFNAIAIDSTDLVLNYSNS